MAHYNPDLSEKLYHRRWVMQFCVVVLGLVVVGVGIRHYIQLRNQRVAEEKARIDAENTRLVQLVQQTKTDLKGLFEKGDFEGANSILSLLRKQNAPKDACSEIEELIRRGGIAYVDRLCVAAESAIEAGDTVKAKRLLDDLESFRHAPRPRRLSTLQQELFRQEFLALIKQSQREFQQRNFDESLKSLDRARRMPRRGPEFEEWQRELTRGIGGRLMIRTNSPGARVQIADAADLLDASEVIAGLPNGEIEYTVWAEGYVAEWGKAHVSFPNVTTVNVELLRAAPPQLWTLGLLRGECAQEAVLGYYLMNSNDPALVSDLKAIKHPCCERRKKPTKEKLNQLTREAIEKYRSGCAKNPIKALDELGKYMTRYPSASKQLLSDKRCREGLNAVVAILEDACSECKGTGRTDCPACRSGRMKTIVLCDNCHGNGAIEHSLCNGTGRAKCPKCKGKGTVKQRVPGDGTLDRYPVDTPCPGPCNGTGFVACMGCSNGLVQCRPCKGTTQVQGVARCRACNRTGEVPCETCGKTGKREAMMPMQRKESETRILELVGEYPP